MAGLETSSHPTRSLQQLKEAFALFSVYQVSVVLGEVLAIVILIGVVLRRREGTLFPVDCSATGSNCMCYFGVITTTATSQMYDVVLWNPVTLLEHAQTVSYTPACRAATFFARLEIFFDQVMLNLTQNSIPAGMDVSGAFPKYFTTRRASLCLIIITAVIQPWRFLSQASIFLTILSSISIYFVTSSAIVLSNYWIVRKKMLKIPDLYTGKDGIYWYTGGFNLRFITALFIGMTPRLPGFIMSCINSNADNVVVKMFQICWFISAPLAFITYNA